jgi:hypothetical protein
MLIIHPLGYEVTLGTSVSLVKECHAVAGLVPEKLSLRLGERSN